MTVACVLRSGGIYTARWVQKLAAGVAEHSPGLRFLCLGDVRVKGVEWVRLKHDWPGWWAKCALWEPGIFEGPTLYLDLDTLVVGDLEPFSALDVDLALLSDFYRPRLGQSGVLLFRPCALTEVLWLRWLGSWKPAMRAYRGDGEWLRAQVPNAPRLQDLLPGAIESWKVHGRNRASEGARLVCAHGRPKFDDPRTGWAHDAWTALA